MLYCGHMVLHYNQGVAEARALTKSRVLQEGTPECQYQCGSHFAMLRLQILLAAKVIPQPFT